MNNRTKKVLRVFSIILLTISIVLFVGAILTDYQGGYEIIKIQESDKIENRYILSIVSFFFLNIIAIIHYADMRSFAKRQYKKSEKANLLIKNYQQIIESKDQEIKEKAECLSTLQNKKLKESYGSPESSETKIDGYEHKIKELEDAIKAITLQKEELAQRLSQISVSPDFNSKRLNLLKHTDSYLQLSKAAKEGKKGDKQLFVELESEIDYLYPNFTKTLFEHYPMITEKQLNLCLLLKAQFQTKDIAPLLCMHHSSISHLKARLFQAIKLEKTDEKINNLSDFINLL